jgi:hypothetical protein
MKGTDELPVPVPIVTLGETRMGFKTLGVHY